MGSNLPKAHERVKQQRPLIRFCRMNLEGFELAKNGHQSHQIGHQVATLVAENDANLALSPRFRQVPFELPLQRKRRLCL
ncbi:hypothetical protein TNCV_1141631 [Trichonephila clavipes]|nr:hypothetical protein TNCV_1141631 [Trichonephila clavipes]